MSERPSRPSSPYLEPPAKNTELEDPGAQDSVASSSDDDHFSDASEGHQRSHSRTLSSPVAPPRTRIEKVDGNPSHGEVPGTHAYGQRGKDAVPDEIEVVPEGCRSRSQSIAGTQSRPTTPGGSSIPQTLVEKVDLNTHSHGDVPGTTAYEQRKADSVPDFVMKMPEDGSTPTSLNPSPSQSPSSADTPVPETRLSRVDSIPNEEGESGVRAHRRSPSDALPDSTESVPDLPEPQSSVQTSLTSRTHTRRRSTLKSHDHALAHGSGATNEELDDFDEFAEEQDDFGDFDDGFQGPGEVAEEPMENTMPQQPPTSPSMQPLIELDSSQSAPDIISSLDTHLDTLFPTTKDTSTLPPVDPIPNTSAVFSTDRSLSLWSQLVAPPPLQPQNWVKSRIRRLFLVSLGVPVDLDEILPASKQKKLVLPSINPDISSDPHSTHSPSTHPVTKTTSTTAPDASGDRTTSPATAARNRQSRRGGAGLGGRGTTPPPDIDLSAVHRLCLTTDAALNGLTDTELETHIKELERVQSRAGVVLEYWVKQRDGLVGEKEAFEGVIENLVSHARRVRK